MPEPDKPSPITEEEFHMGVARKMIDKAVASQTSALEGRIKKIETEQEKDEMSDDNNAALIAAMGNKGGLMGGEGITGLIALLAVLRGNLGLGGADAVSGQNDVHAAINNLQLQLTALQTSQTQYALSAENRDGQHLLEQNIAGVDKAVTGGFTALNAYLCSMDNVAALREQGNLQTLTGMLNTLAATMASCCCNTEKLILQTANQAERTASANQAAVMATMCANQAAIMHQFCEATHHRDIIAAQDAMRDQKQNTDEANARVFALSQELQTAKITAAISSGSGNGNGNGNSK